MKKVFAFCIALSALFASCQSKDYRGNKSLGAGASISRHDEQDGGDGFNGPCCTPPIGQPNYMDSIALSVDSASALIRAYHAYADSAIPTINQHVAPRSFLLNAKALRQYLNADPGIDSVQVYLTMSPDKGIAAVFIGQKRSSTDSVSNIQFYTRIVKQDTTNYVFDMTLPCPKCDGDPFFLSQKASK